VFVAPDPADDTRIFGFYTLSAEGIPREHVSNSYEKKVGRLVGSYSVPMARIGFMGKDDSAPKGFGSVLISDAARRAMASSIGVCGIIVEPEGGQSGNPKLWSWYLDQGFMQCRKAPSSV
jgi:hypothetical protein